MSRSPGKTPPPRYRIVQQGPDRRPLARVLFAFAWAGSLGLAWFWSQSIAAPQLPHVSSELAEARSELERQQTELETLRQRTAILEKSDQVSRAANKQVQRNLAERDEEIAGLRADVAFYERLVGGTAPRKGLNVHSAEFNRETGGTWRYEIVLTQNLRRGAVSKGRLKFMLEGVRDGKLVTVDWDALHQARSAGGQPYSFRYFQQLSGSVMLPPGFTPQRVKLQLRGEGGASVNQTVAWESRGAGSATATNTARHATNGTTNRTTSAAGAAKVIQGES